MKAVFAVILLAPMLVHGQQQEIQRALIQRDQQSAEFAARVRGEDTSRLEQLHARQLLDTLSRPVQPELQPYERQKKADERVLAFPAPAVTTKSPEKPPRLLPLPRRDERLVDPVPAQDPRH
jgi:hypothetical protein